MLDRMLSAMQMLLHASPEGLLVTANCEFLQYALAHTVECADSARAGSPQGPITVFAAFPQVFAVVSTKSDVVERLESVNVSIGKHAAYR